jgi:hypothetical protein
MENELMIVAYGNVTAEGVTLEFNKKVSLHGGIWCKRWWFSWDKIGQSLLPKKYGELSVISEIRRLAKIQQKD